jgi:cell division GTPase FtsZ
MNEDALVIWGARVNPNLAGILRVTIVMTGVNSPQLLSGYGKINPELFDMEPNLKSRKKLKADIGLDQIEL